MNGQVMPIAGYYNWPKLFGKLVLPGIRQGELHQIPFPEVLSSSAVGQCSSHPPGVHQLTLTCQSFNSISNIVMRSFIYNLTFSDLSSNTKL